MNGNEELTAGAAWIAGKAILPIESVSVRPNIAEKEKTISFDFLFRLCNYLSLDCM